MPKMQGGEIHLGVRCKCGKCGKWCIPQTWTSLTTGRKLGFETNIPLCRQCGWLQFNNKLEW